MSSIISNRDARIAGTLYLVASLAGPFAYVFAPSKLRTVGDPAATIQQVLASSGLLRAGVLAELFSSVMLIFAAAALRRLFWNASRWNADLLLLLAALPAAIVFADAATQLAALKIAQGALGASSQSFAPAIVLTLTEIHHQGFVLANIFWGLWLLPLGLAVVECHFIPRALGWGLIAGGFSYVAASAAIIGSPSLVSITNPISWVLGGLSEFGMILWLLIRGVGDSKRAAASPPLRASS